MSKWAIYKLTKVKGKKEYTAEALEIYNSHKAALDGLAVFEEDFLSCPVTYDRIAEEVVAYEGQYDIRFVPRYRETKAGTEVTEPNRRYPIYYIDQYPSPYASYVEKGVREFDWLSFELVGIKQVDE